jgi:methyltransferase (TIGR00027 family)
MTVLQARAAAPAGGTAGPRRPSRTAHINAMQRAGEAIMPPARRLYHDPYAIHFLQRPDYRRVGMYRPVARAVLRGFDALFGGMHAEIVLRNPYYDEQLRRALDAGVEQVVLLGAGYDSTSLRHDLRGATLYEVDAPPTQRRKLEVMRRRGLVPRQPVVYAPCDFEVERARDALARVGFDPERRSFVLWYGVTLYLSDEAVRGTLRDVAGFCAPGSMLLWDYLDEDVPTIETRFKGARRAARAAARRGEPYAWGATREHAEAVAAEAGFRVREHVRVTDLARRYAPPAGVWCCTDDFMGIVNCERA